MSGALKDLTPKEADRWVAQELSKATTRAQVEARIASEEQMVAWLAGRENPFPVSTLAHGRLLDELRLRLAELIR